MKIPKEAMIMSGDWIGMGYGKAWCKIREIQNVSTFPSMSMTHPKFGDFAWVDESDCKFR